MLTKPGTVPSARRPRATPRLRALAASLFAALALGSVGCAEGAPPVTPKTAVDGADAAEAAKQKEGQKKIDDANKALGSKAFRKARKLLKEAAALGVESQRFEIDETLEKLDKKDAKHWSNEVSERLAAKECASAFKSLVEQMDLVKSEGFTRELRKLVADKAVKCVNAKVDESTLAGKFAEARALVNAEDTKGVLGAGWKKVSSELDATITDALRGIVAEDLKAKKWTEALAKLDATVKKGDAGEAEGAAILASIRDALAPEVVAMAARAVATRDAAATLKQVDGLIALVRWQTLPPDQAELAKDKATPADVVKARDTLATWVEAQKASMKVLKAPEKRWTYGKIALVPPTKIDGESKIDLNASSEVWVIGQTKEKALVSSEDPGKAPLPQALAKAVGWVPLGSLAKEATADWLLPDAQLKGTPVWGPLRAPDTGYELGTVDEVKGKDVMVKRAADDKLVQVPRKALRSGRLAVGTKVLAFCTAKDQPATVTEVLPNGRGVKLKCDAGDVTKEEQLPSLRTKVELLPPSKQP